MMCHGVIDNRKGDKESYAEIIIYSHTYYYTLADNPLGETPKKTEITLAKSIVIRGYYLKAGISRVSYLLIYSYIKSG